MNKKIIKLLFFLTIIFTFSYNVKADLNCESAPKHTVKETSMGDPANFDTKAIVCGWMMGGYATVGTLGDGTGSVAKPWGYGNSTYTNGQEFINELVDAFVAGVASFSADGKGEATGVGGTAMKAKRCDSKNPPPKFTYTVTTSGGGCDPCYDPNCDPTKGNCASCYEEPWTDSTSKVSEKDCEYPDKEPRMTSACDISYSESCKVECPTSSCVMTEQVIGACTPSFTADGYRAWCVNPSQNFGKSYNEDPKFDPSKCATSYATTDCGYANILIEAEHYRQNNIKINGRALDDKTIELALRLWGAHSKAGGYVRSGLSIMSTTPGSINGTCFNAFQYISLTAPPNVYKTTERYIVEKFLEYVSEQYKDKDSIDMAKLIEDGKLSTPCDLGLTCGTSKNTTITYKWAYALFFNTLFGNPNMKKHLSDYFGFTTGAPTGINVVQEDGDKTKFEIDYGEYKSLGITENVEFDCDEVKNNSVKYSEAQRKAILPYCQTKIEYTDINGKKSYVLPEMCMGKNSLFCQSKPVRYAICSVEEKQREITITYPDNSFKRIVKMINCGSDDKQIMFSIFPGGKNKGGTNTIPFLIPQYNCGGSCESAELRTDSASCDYDASKPDGEVSKGFVKDPSLKCILNLKSISDRDMFDYSNEFGVNSGYCKVYCSDEVEYYIPDKLTIKDGLRFKYDIAIKSYLNKTDNHLISNVVKSKRTCVSQINYLKPFENAMNFESLFGINDKNIKNGLKYKDENHQFIENWKDLYNVLKAKSDSEAGRQENLNEILYDIYNCNFFSQSVFDEKKVTRPKQRVVANNYDYGNAWQHVKNTYNMSNNYGFANCTINNSTNNCITMNEIEYRGGSEMTSSTFIGKDSTIKLDSVNMSKVSEVKYCSGDTCFYYDGDIKFNSPEDWETYNYSNINSNPVFDGKIPTNEYAMFSIETEVGFYSISRFQSIPSTGYIKPGVSDDKLLTLEEYSYPVSKNAYTRCNSLSYNNGTSCNSSSTNSNMFCPRISGGKDLGPTTTSSCRVTHKYDSVHTYKFRHDNDRLYDKINNDKAFSCYIDVEKSQTQCDAGDKTCKNGINDIMEYRNVDKTNLFPNDEDVPEATNWDTDNARAIKTAIETTGKSVFTNPDFVQYSFTITPTQIKSIRSNNNNISSYMEIGVKDCQVKDGMYFNCRSDFLDEIRNGSADTSETYATINDNHDGSNLFDENKKEVINGN